jgi:hypothetical protein
VRTRLRAGMRIHHLNRGSLCPHGGRLIGGAGGPLSRAKVICHCLLIESSDGLVPVDTGSGPEMPTSATARTGSSTAPRPAATVGFGFGSVRILPGLDIEVALVPLIGHSLGHTGIAVNSLAADNGARVANVERLRELGAGHGDEVDLFSSHDPHELERHQAAPRLADAA